MTPDPKPSTPRIWPVTPLVTSWDDLLDGIETAAQWAAKREETRDRLNQLLCMDAAPGVPADLAIEVHQEIECDDYRIQYISYNVEPDERAHAYLTIPRGTAPEDGFPAVVCLHGTINWGARQTLGLEPDDDPHNTPARINGSAGKDFARRLALKGFATISPEHFCCAQRMPAAGPFDTADFYQRHPQWTAMGKAVHDHAIALSVLADQPEVNPRQIGVTGHSLGAHSTLFLAAWDERIRCAVPNCAAKTFRENSEPLVWSRDRWYVYFPQLRQQFLAGQQPVCDFHDVMALIAPRPLLDCISLNDGDPQGQDHRVGLHLRLHTLYRMLDAPTAHSFLVVGDGHSVSALASNAMVKWMERWLKFDGDPDRSALITE